MSSSSFVTFRNASLIGSFRRAHACGHAQHAGHALGRVLNDGDVMPMDFALKKSITFQEFLSYKNNPQITSWKL